MRYPSAVLPLLTATVISCAAAADQRPTSSQARRWRVMVIVPERHIDRPHIPDPAAETAICRALIDAGYKVIDQDRIAQIREDAVVDRIVQGGPGAGVDAQRLGRRFGADVLIAGEAFTQEETRQVVQTDLGQVTRIQCRGRVELRGIRVDSGEKFYSDSLHQTGAPDATVELASKICLEQLGDSIAPTLLRKLDGLAGSTAQSVELEVRGIGSFSQGRALEQALSHVPGVAEISPGTYEAHTYFLELRLQRVAISRFPAQLESAPSLKPFHLTIQSANGTRIIANAK